MGMNVGGDDNSVMADINVTPMVDVMLVLLIIFMIITPTLLAGFQAQMPQGVHLKTRPDKEDRTTLGIDRFGGYFLNKQAVPGCTADDRATAAGRASCEVQIVQLLTMEYEKHPQDRVLFVKADRTLKYQEILEAMKVGRTAGAKVLAAVTEGKPGAEQKLEEVQEDL